MPIITPPTIMNPMLHNEVVENLQSDLSGLTWLDYIYPLAEVGQKDVNRTQVLIPMCYEQGTTSQSAPNNNYMELFPNQAQRGACFFQLDNGTGQWNRQGDGDIIEITLSIIFWANLNTLAPTRTYDFTDELIASVMNALDAGTYSDEITNISYQKDRNQVFDKYGYKYEELKVLMYPMTAFKVTLNMLVDERLTCYQYTDFSTSQSGS